MLDSEGPVQGTRDVRPESARRIARAPPDRPRRPLPAPPGRQRTPLDETFAGAEGARRQGKVRAVGTSNYEPASLEEAARIAQELGVPYVSEQSEYSWLARDAEAPTPAHVRATRPGLHPLLPARERPPDRQGLARRGRPPRARGCTGASSTTWSSTASSATAAGPRRTASRCSRGDRRSRGGRPGRLGDRRCDEAGAGARERCRRRLGTDAGRAREPAHPVGAPRWPPPSWDWRSRAARGVSAPAADTHRWCAAPSHSLRSSPWPPAAAGRCVGRPFPRPSPESLILTGGARLRPLYAGTRRPASDPDSAGNFHLTPGQERQMKRATPRQHELAERACFHFLKPVVSTKPLSERARASAKRALTAPRPACRLAATTDSRAPPAVHDLSRGRAFFGVERADPTRRAGAEESATPRGSSGARAGAQCEARCGHLAPTATSRSTEHACPIRAFADGPRPGVPDTETGDRRSGDSWPRAWSAASRPSAGR